MERLSAPGLASRLFGTDPARALALLRATWPHVVGAELARRTEVVALEGDTLRVGVPDAVWRKGLLKMRGEILGRLSRLLGEFAPRRISFAEGVQPRITERERAGPPLPVAAIPDGVAAAAGRIADPELRARFLDSAARYLGRFAKPEPGVEDAEPHVASALPSPYGGRDRVGSQDAEPHVASTFPSPYGGRDRVGGQ